jgi:hypothetical protein
LVKNVAYDLPRPTFGPPGDRQEPSEASWWGCRKVRLVIETSLVFSQGACVVAFRGYYYKYCRNTGRFKVVLAIHPLLWGELVLIRLFILLDKTPWRDITNAAL